MHFSTYFPLSFVQNWWNIFRWQSNRLRSTRELRWRKRNVPFFILRFLLEKFSQFCSGINQREFHSQILLIFFRNNWKRTSSTRNFAKETRFIEIREISFSCFDKCVGDCSRWHCLSIKDGLLMCVLSPPLEKPWKFYRLSSNVEENQKNISTNFRSFFIERR